MSAQLLDIASVPAYIAGQPHLAALVDADSLTVVEVGDGNLNLVFIATDATGRSLVLKQSLPYVRMVGESWPLSQDRILAEARGYDAAVEFSPESVPAYHGLDEPRRVIAMEDLSGWTVWRRALNEGRISPRAAAAIGRYVARIGFGTSVFGRDPEKVKYAAAEAVNPELRKITEDLVFTQPYTDHPDNAWRPSIEADVLALREGGLIDEVGVLKYHFVTHAEALIHGDLHTGSVFVPPGESEVAAKVFDIEFSFYGPVAFDLGAFFGNVILAQARAAVLGRPQEFQDWLAGLVAEAWDAFDAEFRALWPTRVDTLYSDTVRDRYLRYTFEDAIGYGGAKAIRRIVGLAKASDIETLDDADYETAARAVLSTARAWIEGRTGFATAADLPRPLA